MYVKNKPLMYLNELEMIDGYLFANIYTYNNIVKIDLNTDRVVKVYDFSELTKIARK